MAKGGTPENQLEKTIAEVNEELEEWAKNGLAIQNVNIITFLLNVKVLALFEIINDLKLMDNNKMELIYNRVLLRELKETREKVQPVMDEARSKLLEETIKPTDMERRVLGPDGKPILQ